MDLFKMIDQVVPPMPPNLRWRVLITFMVIMLIANALWAWGWVPGLQGYAQSAQVQELQHQLTTVQSDTKASVDDIKRTQSTILARLIAGDIEAARVQQCRAIKEANRGAAEGWRVRLDGSLYEFRQLMQQAYNLRSCDEY